MLGFDGVLEVVSPVIQFTDEGGEPCDRNPASVSTGC